MAGGTINSSTLAGCADLIVELGGLPEKIAEAAGVPPEALFSGGITLDVTAQLRFFEQCAERCNARDFGLRLALRRSLQSLGPVYELMRSSETIGSAMEELARHMSFFTHASTLRVIEEAHTLALCYDISSDIQQTHIQVTELSLALLCLEIRSTLGSGWQPVTVQFRHSAPAARRLHRAVLGGRLQFDQDRDALIIDRTTASAPLKSARPRAHKIFAAAMDAEAPFHAPTLAMRVERVLRARLHFAPSNVDVVAAELGLPRRTLQHRLMKEGTTFQSILDRVRVRLAGRYLTESSLAAGEIAELLHFSQTSALSRFLRDRTGDTPRSLRRLHIRRPE